VFDPTSLQDPLALEVAWQPHGSSGSNFRTAKLLDDGGGSLSFRSSAMMKVFAVCFLVFGLGVLGVGALWVTPCALLGLPFAGIGIWLLVPRKISFDPKAQTARVAGRAIPFQSIHALQLLTHRVSGSDGPDFDSHQLNLVLKDRSRVPLVDHSELTRLRSEAEQLCRLVGCKLWDGAAR
jgi:hypothetical protein